MSAPAASTSSTRRSSSRSGGSAKTECMDCSKLSPELRPKVWRKIAPGCGPRSPRCATHKRERRNAERARARDRRRERVYTLTPELFESLRLFQGGYCPCGNRVKHIDHDHRLARRHQHAEDEACEDCLRGLLCHTCNSDILGRGYTMIRLLALIRYMINPPAPRFFAALRDEEAA